MTPKLVAALKEIKTPLAFLSLVVLVAEGIIMAQLQSADLVERRALLIGSVLLPFACLLTFYLMFRPAAGAAAGSLAVKDDIEPPSGTHYELFVSAPMASLADQAAYEASRTAVFEVIRGIKKHCGFRSVFYAGAEIESHKQFESEDLSVVEDYDACFRSTYFTMIYPEKIATSALIELGWAMVHRKPIIIFARRRDDLPFLAKNADSVFSNLRIFEYETTEDIVDRFCVNGRLIFEQLTKGGSRNPR